MPGLDSICFQVYLDELSAHFRDDFMIVLTDNASPHKAKKLIIPVILLPFPEYCPELNPVERLWQYIKSNNALIGKLSQYHPYLSLPP